MTPDGPVPISEKARQIAAPRAAEAPVAAVQAHRIQVDQQQLPAGAFDQEITGLEIAVTDAGRRQTGEDVEQGAVEPVRNHRFSLLPQPVLQGHSRAVCADQAGAAAQRSEPVLQQCQGLRCGYSQQREHVGVLPGYPGPRAPQRAAEAVAPILDIVAFHHQVRARAGDPHHGCGVAVLEPLAGGEF